MGSYSLSQKLVFLIQAVSIYLFPLFSFISVYVCRLQRYGSSSSKKNDDRGNFIEKDDAEFRKFDFDKDEEEEEKTELKFKFPSFEEFSRKGNLFTSEVVPSASTSKYEFTYGKSFVSTFIDELETFPIKENMNNFEQVYNGSRKGKEILRLDGAENEIIEIIETSGEKPGSVQDGEEFLDESEFCSETSSLVTESDSGSTSFEQISSVMNNLVDSHSDYLVSESDSESSSFEKIRWVMNNLVESYSDGFLSGGDFGGSEGESERVELERELSDLQENHELSEDFDDDEESDILEELKNLEEQNLQNPNRQNSDFLSENDFDNDHLDKKCDAGFVSKDDEEKMNGVDDSEKSKESSVSSDHEDANKLESLWEHQELIEQLKMEIRKVTRATGLPTILEESESPKITDDLKPWKIDEKFQHEDCFGGLHKFYKTYRERMRKFDILNYQKMYAMGFLQLKDPVQSNPKQRPVAPSLRSLVSQNIWLSKHEINGSEPMKKFIQELEGDFEVVYVGHMCLSWELLHWQHEKALELWDSDPCRVHHYNEVAGEFQQFQVLTQRFLEDELFQGPRIENYVKSRCVLRNLLQVPVIRKDEKKQARKIEMDDEYVITSDMLVETVEESIRIFWRFVRADKDCCGINYRRKPQVQNPEDLKLLLEVRKSLEKKERKLRDVLRSENCILRKFRSCREDEYESDQVLKFFSQVDLKLVARVLNMSKVTRDQLIWCQSKLGRIRFVNRKMYIEPAFLLFPCS